MSMMSLSYASSILYRMIYSSLTEGGEGSMAGNKNSGRKSSKKDRGSGKSGFTDDTIDVYNESAM